MQGLSHHYDANGASKRGRPKPTQPPTSLSPGQVSFRLLCHVSNIGGVIGRSGTIVKQLEQETGAKIRVEDTVPDCEERVIFIAGFEILHKKVTLKGSGGGEEREVSQAQEALLRVFDRVLEVEAEGSHSGGVTRCRLLAVTSQIGAVMGRGGKTIEKMRKDSGAKIKILPAEQLPACASPADELIQIMGGNLSVKKALVSVSRCLQDCPPLDKAPMAMNRPVETAPYGAFSDPHAQFFPQHSSTLPPFPGNSVDYASSGSSLFADIDRIPSLDAKSTQQEVVFRLLCSTGTVGGVIGKGGAIVKALQNETGASISVAVSVAGCDERVVTVYAFENPESSYSPAQSAVIRVFTRSIEAGIENGFVSKGETVNARLLVASNQIGCLIGIGGRIVSEIRKATGVGIWILGGEEAPNCASEDDEVVQIVGEYENVMNALFQVTCRLRQNLFSSKVLNEAGARSYTSSAIPDISPYGRVKETTSPGLHQSLGRSPDFNQETILTWGMDRLGLSHNTGGPPSPSLQLSQIVDRGNIAAIAETGRGLTTFRGGVELASGRRSAIVTNTTVEIAVPEHVFGSIYGEDGSNMARLTEISGAKVMVHDPYPGKSEGMVIISGTPDQTQVARSLLQAFILTGQ